MKTEEELNYEEDKAQDLPEEDFEGQVLRDELKEEIDQLQNQADHIKKEKKEVPYKVEHSEFPDEQKLGSAISERKALLDNVKMIAYRAETAMANIIRHHMSHPDEARKLHREVYSSDANLLVDKKSEKLTVEIHSMSYHKNDRVVLKLCDRLNNTQTKFPGSNLVLNFKMVSPNNP
jgi:seryl-tRNA(Sec) selenium transferase